MHAYTYTYMHTIAAIRVDGEKLLPLAVALPVETDSGGVVVGMCVDLTQVDTSAPMGNVVSQAVGNGGGWHVRRVPGVRVCVCARVRACACACARVCACVCVCACGW